MNEGALYRSVGRAIAIRRDELQLTQSELAKRVKLSRASLANIETGRQKILLHYLYRIASELELTRIEALLPSQIQPSAPLPTETLEIGGEQLNNKQRAEVTAFFAQATPKRRNIRGNS